MERGGEGWGERNGVGPSCEEYVGGMVGIAVGVWGGIGGIGWLGALQGSTKRKEDDTAQGEKEQEYRRGGVTLWTTRDPKEHVMHVDHFP